MVRKDFYFLAGLTADIIVAHIKGHENAESLVNTIVKKVKSALGNSSFNEDKWRSLLQRELSRNFSEQVAIRIAFVRPR